MSRRAQNRIVQPNEGRSAESVHGPGFDGRRVLNIAVCAFVFLGIAAIILFMKIMLPQRYAQQAKNTILPTLQSAQKDDIVRFGTYEQDNDRTNGAETIEWIVLSRKEDRILLISRYALDCVRWNTAQELVTWDRCTIRQWLNQSFYDTAFNGAQKCLILKTDVPFGENPNFPNVDPGILTQDRIFLMSIEEVFKYFGTDSPKRQCLPTAYARARGAKVDGDAGYCIWWLRSLGFDQSVASRVQTDGSINYCGYHVFSDFNGVRPCIWLSLKMDTDES